MHARFVRLPGLAARQGTQCICEDEFPVENSTCDFCDLEIGGVLNSTPRQDCEMQVGLRRGNRKIARVRVDCADEGGGGGRTGCVAKWQRWVV